jgi:hypothetical protein
MFRCVVWQVRKIISKKTIAYTFRTLRGSGKFKAMFTDFSEVKGRAVAEAVSRWLPTAAVRVRVRATCGVCDGQSGTGAGLLRVLRFPLPIVIPPISLLS